MHHHRDSRRARVHLPSDPIPTTGTEHRVRQPPEWDRVRPRRDRQWYYQDVGLNRPLPQDNLIHFTVLRQSGNGWSAHDRFQGVHTGDLTLPLYRVLS
jgi:hypothetical protein